MVFLFIQKISFVGIDRHNAAHWFASSFMLYYIQGGDLMNLNLSQIRDITLGAVRIEEIDNAIHFARFTKQQEERLDKELLSLTNIFFNSTMPTVQLLSTIWKLNN